MRELYSKRLNILIHGLNELKEAWETITQTKTVLIKYFTEGLKIDLNRSLSLIAIVSRNDLSFNRDKKLQGQLFLNWSMHLIKE